VKEDVKKIKIEDYNYSLPEERIAKYPLERRDLSKLLISKRKGFEISTYQNLTDYLPNQSVLVFNETKVIQARLIFPKNETTTIEIFCLEPYNMDIQLAMQAKGQLLYKCLVGGARKWKNTELQINTNSGHSLRATKIDNQQGVFTIQFNWDDDISFAQVLEEAGKTPLPPYLNRKVEKGDRERYQTVFARVSGSVAAPTASLHFSKELLKRLEEKEVETAKLTLHVGAGTFKPVDAEEMDGHEMHAEEFIVNKALLQQLKVSLSKNIITVGTTSMRALESIYWLGVLIIQNKLTEEEVPFIPQWIAYETYTDLPKPEQAIHAILNYLDAKNLDQIPAKTAIIIAPGYAFKFCKGLITNFHQPKSTLLLLVSAMLQDKWKEMYDFALHHDFRFLSYGDGCLILDLME
jgi:S-adenosylmethionine:tRNA ribosyltransferase-isomerase